MAKKKAPTPRSEPAGMLVSPRVFSPTTRGELDRALRRAPALRHAQARPDRARIIAALSEAADIGDVIVASGDPAAVVGQLDGLVAGIAQARRAILAAQGTLLTSNLLADALARLRHPPDLLVRVLHRLEMLEAVTAAARPRRRHPRGGRPRGGAAVAAISPRGVGLWFAAEVGRILRAHRVPISGYQDGLFADVLRALWPAVFNGQPLEGDTRRLLIAVLT